MDRQLPVLDWERLNDRPVAWSLPAFGLMTRDCLWVIAVAGVAAAWGVDRWQTGKRDDTVFSALTESRAVAGQAQRQEILLSEQLRSVRESLAVLSARRLDDEATIAELRGEISTLQADLQASRRAGQGRNRER